MPAKRKLADAERAITNNTRITIGSAVAIVMVLAGIFFKAGQTLSEFEGVKVQVHNIQNALDRMANKLDDLIRK